ncbi:MAG: STAS domain-containing protein [Bacteroidetes bacterium]|nr:STAS domain-containing protein [Bacteroidota bacterium]
MKRDKLIPDRKIISSGKQQKSKQVTVKAKNRNNVTVLLEGELTLDHLDQVRKILIDCVRKFEIFQINLKNVANIDLACIQLLYALRKSVGEKNKTVTFSLKLSEELNTMLMHAGFDELGH